MQQWSWWILIFKIVHFPWPAFHIPVWNLISVSHIWIIWNGCELSVLGVSAMDCWGMWDPKSGSAFCLRETAALHNKENSGDFWLLDNDSICNSILTPFCKKISGIKIGWSVNAYNSIRVKQKYTKLTLVRLRMSLHMCEWRRRS